MNCPKNSLAGRPFTVSTSSSPVGFPPEVLPPAVLPPELLPLLDGPSAPHPGTLAGLDDPAPDVVPSLDGPCSPLDDAPPDDAPQDEGLLS
jgi:hypothetical protein